MSPSAKLHCDERQTVAATASCPTDRANQVNGSRTRGPRWEEASKVSSKGGNENLLYQLPFASVRCLTKTTMTKNRGSSRPKKENFFDSQYGREHAPHTDRDKCTKSVSQPASSMRNKRIIPQLSFHAEQLCETMMQLCATSERKPIVAPGEQPIW